MAGDFKIDGTTLNYIGGATWNIPTVNTSLNLIAVHNHFRAHEWTANVMAVAEFETLRGKRGSLVSIQTTNADDEDGDFVTYYGVRVDEVSARAHESLNIMGVTVKFSVGA